MAAAGGNLSRGPAKAELRHVFIEALEIAGPYAIRFVPDPDVAIAADRAIEGAPGGAVSAWGILGVTLEMLERSPVLHHHAGFTEPGFDTQQAGLGIGLQFTEHARHRSKDRQPLVNLP